uniref:DUF4907 domain-containing protein n=2 Tax=Flavobacteriaceae TaxID=49546 RepID=UPI00404B43A2
MTGFGYKIYCNEKLVILQENIPALNCNQGFFCSEDAEEIMNLVLKKVRNNQNPSISIQELDEKNIKCVY